MGKKRSKSFNYEKRNCFISFRVKKKSQEKFSFYVNTDELANVIMKESLFYLFSWLFSDATF